MKTLTLLAHAGLFCFNTPPNSELDCRIFNVRKMGILNREAFNVTSLKFCQLVCCMVHTFGKQRSSFVSKRALW